MLLGTLISELKSPDYAAAILSRFGDVMLLARLQDTARRHDEETSDYAAAAVARFSRDGGDEDWLALMTALERAGDPASASLRFMIEWALKADEVHEAHGHEGCTCGGGGGCRGGA